MSLLVIDVGNSNIVFGIFRGEEICGHWRLQTVRERTADEYGLLISQLIKSGARCREGEISAGAGMVSEIDAIALASVVPPLRPTLIEMCRQTFHREPLEISVETDTGLPIEYHPVTAVGADRIVNGVAAYQRYGGPCVVVDFGTATTFDAISADGRYLGGAIAPGIGISMEALFLRAAQLPRIEFRPPSCIIGQTTVESMQSGFVYGFAGQVKEMVERFRQELGPEMKAIATGGFGELIARHTSCIDHVDPMLTLHGLRIVWQRVQDRSLNLAA